MPTVTPNLGTRRGATTRSRGSLPRVASLPPRVTRSRATVNSDVEPIVSPEDLERALAEQAVQSEVVQATPLTDSNAPDQQNTAPISSTEHQRLRDTERRPSGTFHTALQGDQLQVLEMSSKIAAMETDLRSMRTELLALRAQPRTSDVIQDVRQLRVDYNTEREANAALKSELTALKAQQERYEDILELYRSRLEKLELSGTGAPQAQLTSPTQPNLGTRDDHRLSEERVAKPVNDGEHHSSSRSKRAKKRRDVSSSASESSSDTSESSSDTESSTDGRRKRERKSKRHGPTGRVKGPKYGDLRELKPTNVLYKELLSYRYYRLNRTSQRRSTKQTAKVSSFLKRLDLSLSDHKFDGSDPIMVLDFLSRFVSEANVLGMSEGQAYLALPKFLRGFARDQFEAVNQTVGASEGGVTSWPEAVQYLLRSYATGAAISEATSALRNVHQRAEETEIEFSTRLNIAEHRCGNVHSVEERMTYFVDGLDPAIRALVARHREATRRITFIELVQFAKAEVDAHRARKGILRKSAPAGVTFKPLPPKGTKRNTALHIESPEESSVGQYSAQGYDDAALLLSEHSQQSSIPTTDLTDTHSLSGTQMSSDPALAIGYSAQLPAPRIPYQRVSPYLAQRRPGWQVPNPQRGDAQTQQIICHLCYVKGEHIAPQCAHPWKNFASIVHNYDVLAPEEKAIVPARSYNQAKAILHPHQAALAKNVAAPQAQAPNAPRVLVKDPQPTSAQPAPKN